MKSHAVIAASLVLMGSALPALANGETPAWQAPDFVMEEVVVTAPRSAQSPVLAWQEPGYVMEEVIVTAPRIAAEPTQARRRALGRGLLIEPSLRPVARLTWRLIRRAGEFDIQVHALPVAP